ncbi:MAG: hypothetical protein IPG64_19405 [Haliea sp.]|nr:hypothetical protein [Haliea sp.]
MSLPDPPQPKKAKNLDSEHFHFWATNHELVGSLNFPFNRKCFAPDGAEDFEAFAYWGHGINSYDMCYFSKFEERQLHLQLGYGGVYMSPEQNKAALDRLGEITDWKVRTDGLVVKEKTLCVFDEWSFYLTFADGSSLNLAGKPPGCL